MKSEEVIGKNLPKLRPGRFLAGMAGLEPTHARVKVWCLTDLATSPYMSVNVFY